MNAINTVSDIPDPSLPLRIRASRADLTRGEGKVECQTTLPSHYGGNTRHKYTLGEICVQRSTQSLSLANNIKHPEERNNPPEEATLQK